MFEGMYDIRKLEVNKYVDLTIDFFFPKVCTNCETITGNFLCEDCKKLLKPISPESFLTRKSSLNWEVEKSLQNSTNLEKVYYFYEYKSVLHNLISNIKYRYYKGPIEELVNLIIDSKEFQNIDFSEIDSVSYVPLSRSKLSERGFCHTKILAEKIAKYLNKPIIEILEKTKNTKPQAELGRAQRLVNLQGSFGLKEIEINPNSKILLIDDICTTGSTFEECAKTIKSKFPGTRIYGLALARGKAS